MTQPTALRTSLMKILSTAGLHYNQDHESIRVAEPEQQLEASLFWYQDPRRLKNGTTYR